jgi:hypothetical protein
VTVTSRRPLRARLDPRLGAVPAPGSDETGQPLLRGGISAASAMTASIVPGSYTLESGPKLFILIRRGVANLVGFAGC